MESPVTLVRSTSLLVLLLSALLLPGRMAAQEPPPDPGAEVPADLLLVGDDPVPGNLAALETARTRMCVPALARLAEVDARLQPLAGRSNRIVALAQAVTAEDSLAVSPLDGNDALETAVREWFQADVALALRFLDSGDESIQEERSQGKAAIRSRLEEAFREANDAAQEILTSAEGLDPAALDCQNAFLIRSVALEVCATTPSPVCAEARNEGEVQAFRFVDAAEDLWDMEQLIPWSAPSPIFPTPDGQLGGARTTAVTRRGNLALSLALEPMIRGRESLGPEEAAGYDENLQELGFTFDHPALVMAPVLLLELDLPGRLGEETFYLLHFGDLSDPANQVIWTFEAEVDGPIQAILPVAREVLDRLAAEEELSVTAVHIPEDESQQGSAIFTMGATSLGQGRAISTLISYMEDGRLSQDLARFIPVEEDPAGG